MAANDNVTVSIVGNAAGVAPAVDQAKADLGGLKAAVSELTASMSKLGADMRSSMASGASVGKAVAGGMKEAQVATNAESNALERMVMKMHEGAEAVRTFQMRAKAFAEVYVAAFAVEQIAEFVNKMGEAAEKVQHLAQQFGMTTGQIQQLQGVATATGIPIEALTKGMAFLDRNMANAEAGSKKLKATMSQVGISFNDGRSQMEKLAVVADKFKNMDDGPKKVALAMQLFGRSGKELIPILDLGSKGIEELNKKMDEYGVRNEDAVAKGAALAESVNETKLGFLGISNVLTDPRWRRHSRSLLMASTA
jgi:ABC-type transporter Mla subunit MlaD